MLVALSNGTTQRFDIELDTIEAEAAILGALDEGESSLKWSVEVIIE